MHRAMRLVLLLTLSTLLAACDPVYGINSQQVVQGNVEDACIIQALKHTPGISNVREQTALVTGRMILGDGPQHGSKIRYFIYETGTKYSPTFMIEDLGGGRYQYSDTMLSMQRMPRAVIGKTLPIMIDAEMRITRECGVEIDTGMKHSCYGSPCEVF